MLKKWIIFLGLASLIGLASCQGNIEKETTSIVETTTVDTTTIVKTTTKVEETTTVEATIVETTTSKEDIYYTVTFINYDDSLLLSLKVKEGEDAFYTLEAPTKPQDDEFTYEFSGWDVSLENIQKDLTAKAEYTPKAKTDWGGIEWF